MGSPSAASRLHWLHGRIAVSLAAYQALASTLAEGCNPSARVSGARVARRESPEPCHERQKASPAGGKVRGGVDPKV